MWIDYGERIPEAVAVLQEQVRTERERGVADRLRLLWLWKSGSVRSLGGAAAVRGYSERQGKRWWACSAAGGPAAPAWRQPRADQCCGLGGAKRPPARRRDRAAEGRAGLSARAVGDCLLPGCAL